MGFPIIEGFDLYASTAGDVGLLNRWTNLSAGGGPSIIAGRFGGQALRMSDGTGDTSFVRRAYAGAHSAFSIGMAIRGNSLANLGNNAFVRIESASGTQLSLYMDGGANRKIRVYRGLGTTLIVDCPPAVITNATWSYVTVRGLIDQTVGWVELTVDGAFIGRFDGDTAALAGSTMDGILLTCPDHSGSGNTVDFDDLYVADVSTDYGQCRIETLRPTADTAQKDFTPSTAGTNFDDVDDATFAAADYVGSSTLNHYDLYDLANLSSNPALIHAVKPLMCGLKTDAGGRMAACVIDSNTTLNTSGNLLLTNTNKIFDGQALLLDPSGGGAWTGARVDGIKLGPKVAV